MSDATVLILTGPPGAGKTTTARLLAARSHAGLAEPEVVEKLWRGRARARWRSFWPAA